MSYKLKDVMYENKSHWVLRTDGGYEIYKIECTHSVRCAQIGFNGDIGLKKAITECDKRDAS